MLDGSYVIVKFDIERTCLGWGGPITGRKGSNDDAVDTSQLPDMKAIGADMMVVPEGGAYAMNTEVTVGSSI